MSRFVITTCLSGELVDWVIEEGESSGTSRLTPYFAPTHLGNPQPLSTVQRGYVRRP